MTVYYLFSDIDECLDRSAHHCHDDAICTNIKGGFSCSCPRGYSGNGIICVLNSKTLYNSQSPVVLFRVDY